MFGDILKDKFWNKAFADFNVIQWNCDAISNKLVFLINKIKEINSLLVLINEPNKWYKENKGNGKWEERKESFELPEIPGFEPYCDFYGRSGIYVHKSLIHEHLHLIPSKQRGETPESAVYSTWIRLVGDNRIKFKKNKDIYVGSIYRPPYTSNNVLDLKVDIDYITHYHKDNDYKAAYNWICGGDLNVTSERVGAATLTSQSDTRYTEGEKLVKYIDDNNFQILNNGEFTHINRVTKNKNHIDWTITDSTFDINDCEWRTLSDRHRSDHKVIVFKINKDQIQREDGHTWAWNIHDGLDWTKFPPLLDQKLKEWRTNYRDSGIFNVGGDVRTGVDENRINEIIQDYIVNFYNASEEFAGIRTKDLNDLKYFNKECKLISRKFTKISKKKKELKRFGYYDNKTDREFRKIAAERKNIHNNTERNFIQNTFSAEFIGGKSYWQCVQTIRNIKKRTGKTICNLYDKQTGKVKARTTKEISSVLLHHFSRWDTNNKDILRDEKSANSWLDDENYEIEEKDPDYEDYVFISDKVLYDRIPYILDEDDQMEQEEDTSNLYDDRRNRQYPNSIHFKRWYNEYIYKQRKKFVNTGKFLKELNGRIFKGEIKAAVFSFDTDKALGPDELHFKFIKESYDWIEDDLYFIYTLCYNNGIIPSALKEYYLNPILKNGKDSKYVESYRPIALTPIISRIFEKLLSKRLQSYLVKAKLLQNHFGFIKSIGTADAITNLLDSISNNFKHRNGHTHGVFLDFSAAFDTVNRDILRNKLKNEYGISGQFFDIISSFLTDRKYAVKINNYTSEWRESKYGVPQGSPLSPILFLCYINGLSAINGWNDILIQYYADDTMIYNTSCKYIFNKNKIKWIFQTALNYIDWYCKRNELHINGAKSQYLVFKKQRLRKDYYMDLELNGESITKQQEAVTVLGMTLDFQLKWDHHIKKQVNSCYRIFYQIRHNLRYLWNVSAETVPNIIEVCILNKLYYNVGLLGNVPITSLSKWQVFLNKLMKFIVGSHNIKKKTSILALQNLCNWKSVFIEIKKKASLYWSSAFRSSEASPLHDTIKNEWFTKYKKIYSNWSEYKENTKDFIHLNDKEKFEEFNIKKGYDTNILTRDWRTFSKHYKITKKYNTKSPLFYCFKWALIAGTGDVSHLKEATNYDQIPKKVSYHFEPYEKQEKGEKINIKYINDSFNDPDAVINHEKYKEELFCFTDGSVATSGLGGCGLIGIWSENYLKAYYEPNQDIFLPNWHDINVYEKDKYEEKLDKLDCNDNVEFYGVMPVSVRASIDYCELMAILHTLQQLETAYIDKYDDGTSQSRIRPKAIRIISDSMTSLKWISGIWMPNEKRIYDLILLIRSSIISINHYMECPVLLHFVKAHKGTIGNEMADFLANAAVFDAQQNYMEKPKREQDQFRDNNRSFLINSWSATSVKMDKNVLKRTWDIIWHNHYHAELLKKSEESDRKNKAISWWNREMTVTPHPQFRRDFKRFTRLEMKLINLSRLNKLYLKDLLYDAELSCSNICDYCNEDEKEDIFHYFLKCPNYKKERKIMITELDEIYEEVHRDGESLRYWSDSYTLKLLLFPCLMEMNKKRQNLISDILNNYITSTKRFLKDKLLKELDYVTHC